MSAVEVRIKYIDGTHCVTRKDLVTFLGVTREQIISYEKATNYDTPLAQLDKSYYGLKGRDSYYDLKYALLWHRDNVSQKYSAKENKYTGMQQEESEESDYKAGDKITSKNAKTAKEIENAINEKNKRILSDLEIKIAKKEYIPSENADKAMTEHAVLMLSELRNFKDNIPHEVIQTLKDAIPQEQYSEYESKIEQMLDDAIQEMIDTISERVNEYESQ